MQPNLYHTYPLVALDLLRPRHHVFIEGHECLRSSKYLDGILAGDSSYILDCGVGASPDLNDPMGHVQGDPSFGVKYLSLMVQIEPKVLVIPDVLGNAQATLDNIYYYLDIISMMDGFEKPQFMYVIQGQTEEEALEQIKFAMRVRPLKWIGFPRIVHYYGQEDSTVLTDKRIEFIQPFVDVLKDAGKKIHLLGVNSIEELIWVAENGLSTDTRLATLAAVNDFDVTQPRPFNVKADLCDNYSLEVKQQIIRNMEKLDTIFYRSC